MHVPVPLMHTRNREKVAPGVDNMMKPKTNQESWLCSLSSPSPLSWLKIYSICLLCPLYAHKGDFMAWEWTQFACG